MTVPYIALKCSISIILSSLLGIKGSATNGNLNILQGEKKKKNLQILHQKPHTNSEHAEPLQRVYEEKHYH